ncbi:MAG: class I SAM-dependent methyltransferase [Bacteroidota bacterium]
MSNLLSRSRISYSVCPICRSSEISEVLNAKDYTVSKENFSIWHCSNCQGRFTQEIPDQNSIGPYYQSEEYISHSNTDKGLINTLYQWVRNYTLVKKRKLITKLSKKSGGNILDIGCGTGEFLGAMKEAGWKVQGLEPDPGARKQAQKNQAISVSPSEELFNLKDGDYDVISMWHVLEHVHQLHEYFEKIRALLKPGGLLIIAVPNYQSLDAKVYGEHWAAYDVPRHLYHFSARSMKELFKFHQIEFEQIKPMPFDAFYVSLLSEKYRHGNVRLIPAGITGLRSFLKSSFQTDTCSSILYVGKKGNE